MFDPDYTGPRWPPSLIPRVGSWRSPGAVVSSSGSLFDIENLFYKLSFGSAPLSQGAVRRLRTAAVTSGLVKFSKPKRPVFYELKFYGRPPVFKPVDPSSFALPKRPKNFDAHKWSLKEPLYQHRRLNLISKANERREASYKRRKDAYDKRYTDFLRRQAEHRRIFEIRLQKYYRRLALYEKAVDKAAKRLLYLLPKRSGYTEHHPYLELSLMSSGSSPSTLNVTWNTLPPVDDNVNIANDTFTGDITSFMESKTDRDMYLGSFASTLASAISPKLEDFEGALIRKLYDRIANQQVHFGNLIAERKQTLEMIASVWLRLKDLVLLKRGLLKRLGNYATNPKAWADDVLAFKFGAEPLIKEISQGIEFLNSGDPTPLTVKARASKSIPNLELDLGFGSFKGIAVIRYFSEFDADSDITRLTSQFGLLDISQVLWEVTPWSFVVDWMIPIGSWIQAQTASNGLSFTRATRSFSLTGEFKIHDATLRSTSIPPSENMILFSGEFSGYLRSREIDIELPDKNRILFVKSPWSWSHAVEAVALAVQRLK